MALPRLFHDRADAGRRLAAALTRFRDRAPLVLGLPRGGVVVAREIAVALDAPLDVWIARKIGAPHQPELGLGAVAEPDETFVDPQFVRRAGASDEEVEAIASMKRAEVVERQRLFRGDGPPPEIRGRTVIVVDDGLATGGTARAALRAIRRQEPRHLVLAVPVGSARTIETMRDEADEIVCLEPLEELWAVGIWYYDFRPVTDREVIDMLAVAAKRSARAVAAADARVEKSVHIVLPGAVLEGDLVVPPRAVGLVLFAHGSGSSRRSPRNRAVASVLQRAGVGTLLFDLLTREEEQADAIDAHLRFDIALLTRRLVEVTDWVAAQSDLARLPLGYFGASTGAAAALFAATARPHVRAVVSRGGRPDLAMPVLASVTAPTLLVVGGSDHGVLRLNREAHARLGGPKRLEIVPGATHLFDERGALERAAELAASWFATHLPHTAVGPVERATTST